jgi:hypothetical protein
MTMPNVPPTRRRLVGAAAVLAVVLAVACGPSQGTDDPPDDAFTPPPAPEHGTQVVVDDFTVAPFSELERCRYINAPNDAAGHVVRIELVARAGLHHAFVSKAPRELADDDVPCFGFPDEVMQGIDIPAPLYASSTQVAEEVVAFPEGVGIEIEAGQQLVFNYHYLNTGPDPIDGEIYLNLHFADPEAEIASAQVFVFGNMGGVDIPPHGTQRLTTTCAFPDDVALVSATPHMHALGTRFEIRRHDGEAPAEMLLETTDWHDPETKIFDPPLLLSAGEGLTFTCEWRNDLDHPVGFGQTAEDEMCFVFGYFYPGDEQILQLEINGCTTEESVTDF